LASIIYEAIVKQYLKDEEEGPDNNGGNSGGQQIAIASYTNPLGDPTAWQRLISYDSSKLSVLVANVLNGPDYVNIYGIISSHPTTCLAAAKEFRGKYIQSSLFFRD